MLCYKKIGAESAEIESIIWRIKFETEKSEFTSFFVQAPTVWNVLPPDLFMAVSFSLFRS